MTAFHIYQRVIAAFYGYGALVHVLNLLGFGPESPDDRRVVFRALDVVFLVLDLIVVVGLWRSQSWGLWAFFAAAIAQIVMYVGFTEFFVTDQVQRGQLMGLVAFHVISGGVMLGLLLFQRNSPG